MYNVGAFATHFEIHIVTSKVSIDSHNATESQNMTSLAKHQLANVQDQALRPPFHLLILHHTVIQDSACHYEQHAGPILWMQADSIRVGAKP